MADLARSYGVLCSDGTLFIGCASIEEARAAAKVMTPDAVAVVSARTNTERKGNA